MGIVPQHFMPHLIGARCRKSMYRVLFRSCSGAIPKIPTPFVGVVAGIKKINSSTGYIMCVFESSFWYWVINIERITGAAIPGAEAVVGIIGHGTKRIGR